jgi:hypothetical protein
MSERASVAYSEPASTLCSEQNTDSLAAFLNGVVWQASYIEAFLKRRRNIYLNFHEVRVDSKYGRTEGFE